MKTTLIHPDSSERGVVARAVCLASFRSDNPLSFFRGGGPHPSLGVATPVTVRKAHRP